MKTKQFNLEKEEALKKAMYVDHLSPEENEMLDIMANIIAKYVIRTVDERSQKERNPQKESNRYYSDSK